MLAVLLAGVAWADDGGAVVTNTCLVPCAKLENDSYDWWARHEKVLKLQKEIDPEIVFVGDSITHFWAGAESIGERGPLTRKRWTDRFGKWRTLNIGYGWDRIQNVLWRLEHGEMDGLNPRVIVLHIGTNNVGGTPHARANTPEEIAEGTAEIVRRLEKKAPKARIVVMAIFPREEKAGSFWRRVTAKSNAILAGLVKGDSRVRYLDIGQRFLDGEGNLTREIMADFVHPTDRGYAIWADAIMPYLEGEL